MTTPNPGCQWFAWCENPATDTQLGPQFTPDGIEMIQIPACDRCAASNPDAVADMKSAADRWKGNIGLAEAV